MKIYSAVLILIILLGCVIYGQTLNYPFQFDDYIYIVDNKSIIDPSKITNIWNALAAPARFIGFYSFSLNYSLNRFDMVGYHIVNIFIHICNAFLVFWFSQLLFKTPKIEKYFENKDKLLIGIAASLVFLVHPIQTQAVTYICQRFTSLAAFFYLLSVCLYIKGRLNCRIVFYLGSFMALLIGMFTKEIVMTLPLVIVLIEFMFISKQSISIVFKKRFLNFMIIISLFMIIPIMYKFNVKGFLEISVESWSHRGDMLTVKSYFLTQQRVILTYLRLLFFPVNQNLLYDFKTSNSLMELNTLISASLIMGLIILAILLVKKYKLMAFGIFWFFITLSVESSLIVIKHVIFEHRSYLPSVGFSLITGLGIFYLIKDYKKRIAILVVVVVTLSFLSIERNKVWASTQSLWMDVLKKSPNQIRPYVFLGVDNLNKGKFSKALEFFNKAMVIVPDDAQLFNNRGNVYMQMNNMELALKDYEKALSIDPLLHKTYNNRGVVYKNLKEFDLALKDFDKAIELDSENSSAYYNKANIYILENDLDSALINLNKVLEINPFHTKGYYYRAQIFLNKGKKEEALSDIIKAQDLGYKKADQLMPFIHLR